MGFSQFCAWQLVSICLYTPRGTSRDDTSMQRETCIRTSGWIVTETISLSSPPDATIITQFGSLGRPFAQQLVDVSYGLTQLADGSVTSKVGYQARPTPGSQNLDTDEVHVGFVADTQLSIGRGFYRTTQMVEVTTRTPGATIAYTTDGSVPTLNNGVTATAANPDGRATATVRIESTTTLRAAAFKADHLASTVATHSYIFVDDVIRQDNSPEGFPAQWKSNAQFQAADYEMDSEITQDPAYRDLLDDALLAIPTISIVTPAHHLFDLASGIYMNPENHGVQWERPASVEWILARWPRGFSRRRGAADSGRRQSSPRALAGSTRFGYFSRAFTETPSCAIHCSVIRQSPNSTRSFCAPVSIKAGSTPTSFKETIAGGLNTSAIQWAKETQRAMGQNAPHTNYAHLYLNGVYWGLYNPTERPSATFAADYFGGDKENYDAINSGQVGRW